MFRGDVNLAAAGKASQVSTDYAGPAELAIDGVTDGDYAAAKSTTHTRQQADPWWIAAVSAYRSLTGRDPWISLMVVNEWEYGPLFYRGVMHEAREVGVSGINFIDSLPAAFPSQ